jgi:hypothetical protein
MLNKLKKLILADVINKKWDQKEVSLDELNNESYSDILKAYIKNTNSYIYRGDKNLDNTKCYEITPGLRKSAKGVSNIYTTLFSEILPSWSKYPKRNHCIIGVIGDSETAKVYGKRFILIPKNGTSIGICYKSDIWGSFENLREFGDLKNLDNILQIIFNYVKFKISGTDVKMEEYYNKNKLLKDIEILLKFLDNRDNRNHFEVEVYPYVKKICSVGHIDQIVYFILDNRNNLLKAFDELLNPDINKFSLINTNNFHNSYSIEREVWFDNTCLCIPQEIFEDFINVIK